MKAMSLRGQLGEVEAAIENGIPHPIDVRLIRGVEAA